MRKILVTGSEGNIGNFITEKIRSLLPDTRLIRTVFGGQNTVLGEGAYRGDLRDPAFARMIFRDHPDIDCVIHAAAPSYNGEKFKTQPFAVFGDDITCLLNILGYCPSKDVKVIYLSSVMVYEAVSEIPFVEEATDRYPAPLTPYGLAKFTGEKAVRLHAQQNGCDFTIWRLFNIVSPLEDHTRPGAHVFVDFYRQLYVERVPELKISGDGHQVRCFTWVEEIAESIIRSLDDPRTSGQTFNFGGTEPKTLLELAEMLLAVGHELKFLPQDYRPLIKTGGTFAGLDVGKRIASVEKAHNLLGLSATTGFRTMFEKFVTAKREYANQ
jgi:nucleoside-diphosphate-sugar epimerase